MSSDICGEPDLSKKVRYSRKEQEDRGEWEQREVDIYESTDDIRDNDTNFQAHEGGPQTQSPPSVQKGSFRCATLGLRVLCLLMLAGIIILSICFGWNKSEYDKLHNSYIQFHDKVLDNMSQLQSSYDTLSENNSDIQEEVKKLKEKIKEKCPKGWKRRLGCSCYIKSCEKKLCDESWKACQYKGADLVMINSKEEQVLGSRTAGSEFWLLCTVP
uniref:Uncharacterized protein n=1 Tax=Oreochromis aureus TaxID=47969 RepID=A0AAZ1XWW0_OREAU